jgi:hypothetical protein
VQVGERGAQLRDEGAQAVDAGGRAFLMLDTVVGDDPFQGIEVAIIEAALDQGSADLFVWVVDVSVIMARNLATGVGL